MVDRSVTLRGLTELMFDRYPGDNDTQLEWHQKLYMIPETSRLCIPAMNIVSFLSSHNTNSAPKRLRDKRKYKDIANSCLSFVIVTAKDGSQNIPILGADDEPISLGIPGVDRDKKSGVYLHRSVARLDKGIPNPKERPVVPLPWAIDFRIRFIPNKEIKEQEVRNLMLEGGLAIGLGTYRGVFGKFEIDEWK
jgi:hypothetical protein